MMQWPFEAPSLSRLCGMAFGLLLPLAALATPGDWPEVRQNPQLTAVQPLPGSMKQAPVSLARYDLGRSQPALTPVAVEGGHVALCIVAGGLRCYDTAGALRWASHPPGLNFTAIKASEDLDGDGSTEVLLMAGRPTEPYAAAVLVALADGRVLWRYDVEPMSYAWYLYAGRYLPGVAPKQIVVIMHGYPPDKDNGYIALFEYPEPGAPPEQKWRYDFDAYTCFPSFLETDLDGDGVKELVVETHSRMWFLDAVTGAVKHFAQWDVAPGNVRSYGLVEFVDLDRDGLEDFLCIADFAQHHEVLFNRDGRMQRAWCHAWAESVTTGKVATTWPQPPYADLDGDGQYEIVVSMFNSEGQGQWLVRAYDAMTGAVKYRAPGLIAVAVLGSGEVLANACEDATQSVLRGAHVLRVTDGNLATVWQDATATAVKPQGDAPALIESDGKRRVVRIEEDGLVALAQWTPPPAPPAPDFSAVPATQGPGFPTLLAADCTGDGTNEIILYREPAVEVLAWQDAGMAKVATYTSSAPPVLADLNGDGAIEMVSCVVTPDALPVVTAVTPASSDGPLWRTQLEAPARPGLPQPRRAYLRTGHFTGKPTPDVYLWAGTPVVRSVLLDGTSGEMLWDKGECPGISRYWGPSVNLASVWDYDGDGNEDLVFTNPDYYCIASGATGAFLLGPAFPPKIFSQPSQGLYTLPAILENDDAVPTVCLVSGHYFQAAMSIQAAPLWYKLPVPGEHAPKREGFLRLADGSWVMGFGRQNGAFACVNVADGTMRWELPLQATASDVVTCDVDGDGRFEFVFGTSHGRLCAVGDDGKGPRPVWTVDLGAAVGSPIAADVNGDGSSEIVAPTADGYVHVFGAAGHTSR